MQNTMSESTSRERPETHGARLQYLQIASTTVNRHHGALWEEEKHYTWWISVLFAAALATYLAPSLSPVEQAVPMLCVAVVGCLMSLAAYRVISLEGQYFSEARQSYVRALKSLGISQVYIDDQAVELAPGLQIIPFAETRSRGNRGGWRLIQAMRPLAMNPLGIREVFKLTFVGSFIAFLLMGIATIVLICHNEPVTVLAQLIRAG